MRISDWSSDVCSSDLDWLADAVREHAARLAAQIREWLDGGLMLQSKGCALRPGDIMILVRKRSDLARLIVARLYEEKVPVAGIDRLRLNAPLAEIGRASGRDRVCQYG